MEMTNANLRKLRDAMAMALVGVGKELGGEISVGRISYSESEVTIKVSFKNLDENGQPVVDSHNEQMARLSFHLAGRNDEDQPIIGSRFYHAFKDGVVVTIIDYDGKKRTYPFIYKIDGRDGVYKGNVHIFGNRA